MTQNLWFSSMSAPSFHVSSLDELHARFCSISRLEIRYHYLWINLINFMFLQLSFCMIPLLRDNLDLLSIWIFLITIAYLLRFMILELKKRKNQTNSHFWWMTLQGFHQLTPWTFNYIFFGLIWLCMCIVQLSLLI